MMAAAEHGDEPESGGGHPNGGETEHGGETERGGGAERGGRTEPFGSDLRLVAQGPDAAAALEEAALAFGRILAGGPRREEESRAIALEAADREALLVAFLEEVLFLFETEKLLPADVAIEHLTDTAFEGVLHCDRFDPARHEAGRGVKAVTWHDLAWEESDEGVALGVVLDL